jgi:hypothetical protein
VQVGRQMSHPVCYNRLMIIETDMKEKPTYELWYLGDRCNSLVKCRESFNKLLIDAAELMRCGREAGLSVGGIEICCVSADGRDVETVWHHNHADDKKKKVAR